MHSTLEREAPESGRGEVHLRRIYCKCSLVDFEDLISGEAWF